MWWHSSHRLIKFTGLNASLRISSIVAAIIMVLIGKRDVKQIILVSVLVPLLMWLVFYKLLTVNIPMGVLQPLKNLVDMI